MYKVVISSGEDKQEIDMFGPFETENEAAHAARLYVRKYHKDGLRFYGGGLRVEDEKSYFYGFLEQSPEQWAAVTIETI